MCWSLPCWSALPLEVGILILIFVKTNGLALSMISSIAVLFILVADLRYDRVCFPQLTSLNVKCSDCIPMTGLIMVGNFTAFFGFCTSKTLSFVKTPEEHSRRACSTY